MKLDLKRALAPPSAGRSSSLLLRITEALDVPVDALTAREGSRVLHTAVDGATWNLLRDARGNVVVRHTKNTDEGDLPVDESVSDFLAHDIRSPQREALATLIDHLLEVHLAG